MIEQDHTNVMVHETIYLNDDERRVGDNLEDSAVGGEKNGSEAIEDEVFLNNKSLQTT